MILELTVAVISVAVVLAWWLIRPPSRLKKYGDKIPGPPTQPLVGNALTFSVAGKKAPIDMMDCTLKYGRVFRVWLGPQLHVFISDPADNQAILSSSTIITKANSYFVFDSWLGTGLLVSKGDLWRKRRKAITPTFHFKVLDDFVPIFEKCANTLVDCLEDKVGKSTFDVSSYISNCALDTVSESAMDIQLEAQTKPNSEYVTTILEMTLLLIKKINFPWVAVDPLYTLLGYRKNETNFLKILHSIPAKVLAEKRKKFEMKVDDDPSYSEFGIKKRSAFLERLLNIQNTDRDAFQSDQDIMDEVTTFMFEGHDTTTACLSFTTWLLGKHPQIQENVYKEVAALYSQGSALKKEELQEMKYLERVIKESLRLYPPVPIYGRVIEEDLVLPSGYTLPAGADVYSMPIVMHRLPDIFPDPEVFNPDRFLDEQRHPYAYIPFSAGPRNCIGQKFAMLDLKAIMSKLVYNYKIVSEDDVVMSHETILRAHNGVNISLTKRAHEL